jgi:hypothetical protein
MRMVLFAARCSKDQGATKHVLDGKGFPTTNNAKIDFTI